MKKREHKREVKQEENQENTSDADKQNKPEQELRVLSNVGRTARSWKDWRIINYRISEKI